MTHKFGSVRTKQKYEIKSTLVAGVSMKAFKRRQLQKKARSGKILENQYKKSQNRRHQSEHKVIYI